MNDNAFETHIRQLLAAGGGCLTIEGPEDEIVQVADEGDPASIAVQLGYFPTTTHPSEALNQVSVDVPPDWRLVEWEEDVFASFLAPRGNPEQISHFLREVFEKFFGVHSLGDLTFTHE